MKLSVFIVYLALSVVSGQDASCFQSDVEKLEHHLSTKTPYRVIADKISGEDPFKFKGCSAVRNWAVIRHGSRNPSAKIIKRMNTDLYSFKDQILRKGNLCDNDKDAFRDWESHLSEDEEKNLVQEGEDELIDLAERFQKRFPDLLAEVYDNSTYKFKYTLTERTERSAKSFATGLFGRENIKQIWYHPPLHRDPILRFYKLCARWRSNINKNPETYRENEEFIATEAVQSLVNVIRSKTGIPNLKFIDLQVMYQACAFETAWWKRKSSPWCRLFTNQGIRVMEFSEDLKYYWKDGYGYDLTHSQACPAIRDLVEHLELNSTQPASTFYFTHSGTVLKLLAALQLYKDDNKLAHSDFGKERQWRTSQIDAFASNLMFVTFNCAQKPHLLFLHQERVVRLPGCPQDRDLCPLEVFKERYKHHLEECNFNKLCEL